MSEGTARSAPGSIHRIAIHARDGGERITCRRIFRRSSTVINKIVLDLETQKDFAEVGGRSRHHLLRVSLAGIYSYRDNRFQVFGERDLHKLGEILTMADQVIGDNIKQFDYAVLRPYLNFSVAELPTLDLLEEVEKVLGHRISLNAIASATLNEQKTGTGLNAIKLWRNSQIDELKAYCLNDVKLTKDVYDFAMRNQKLLYKDFFETKEIPLRLTEPEPRGNVTVQESLF